MSSPVFTAEQLSATEYLERDACVVAGPGSGKTTVLVERFRRLVVERKFDARHILAITFTEKAAANMKAKLAAQFQGNSVLLRDLESAWVSTIHGFCARLLREHAIAAGLDPHFAVLSPRESDNLQWDCLHTSLDELTAQRREATLELIEALQVPSLAGDLKDVYDAMRSAGMSVEQVRDMSRPDKTEPGNIAAELRAILHSWPVSVTPLQASERTRLLEWTHEFESAGDMTFGKFFDLKERLRINLQRVPKSAADAMREFRELRSTTAWIVDHHAAPFREIIFDVLARFDDEYRRRKTERGRVDFNDLERHAIALLKDNPEVRHWVHTRFRQIMLDEFQDINGQQAELIAMLRAPNVFFAVGDVNQSIYGFRHARPELFLQYQEEVDSQEGQSVSLLHNFRSREPILRFVGEVLSQEAGIQKRELVPGAVFPPKAEASIEILKVVAPDSDREAKWLARRILELRRTLRIGGLGETRSPDYGDFAVLCRNSDSMPAILTAFDHAGIPYISGRRQSFLLSREGLDITALLSVVSNPRDSISLATVLRGPMVGASDEALLRLRLMAGSLTGGLNKFAYDPSAGIPEPDATKLRCFCSNLDRWRSDLGIVSLDMLLSRALAECGLRWTPDIESFLQLARTTGASMALEDFLQEIESLSDGAGMESELSDEDQGNTVQVMTVHAAKGLEFPVTIIAGMERGSRRESRPLTFSREYGLGVKWRNPVSKDGEDSLKDSWAEANKRALQIRESEEENRLLYVAMTRAEEHLILSYTCGVRGKPKNWAQLIDDRFNQQPEVSVFVTDADPPEVSGTQLDGGGTDIEIVERPLLFDQHETSMTVTSLAVFGTCPRKYYLQRSLGWNTGRFRRFDADDISADTDEDDSVDLSASRVGSAVHEILAGAIPSDDVPEARRLAEVFRNGELGRRVEISTRVEREWSFMAEVEGAILSGTIDLWFEENGDLHIVDYKTDELVRPQEYAPQLALYAIALERALGTRPKSAWLHFLRSDTIVEVPVDTVAARSLITGLRQAQDELRFDLNEGEHCKTCQFYRSLCPAGKSNVILEAVEPDNHSAGN
jgi:ATP-dependent exoDNAse (exonuclease V) beta subunit